MQNNHSNGSRAASARGFVALCAMLAVGLGLMARPAEAAPFAYVTSGINLSTVSVIDTITNTLVATVGVGRSPYLAAVSPDGKHTYVTNAGGNTVSVIATATNTVVATVPVGNEPVAIAITPDGNLAYVTNVNFLSVGTVSVIATATNTVVATVPVGSEPGGVAVTPDGQHAYVTNSGSDNVSVIATATNKVMATFPVGIDPQGVAVTPDGKHAYVVNAIDDTVSVILTGNNTVVATVPVGRGPFAVVITPDGKDIYVTNEFSSSGTVTVIATATNAVVATVPVGPQPFGVAITPDGKHVYVTSGTPNGVSVIYTATNKVVATVPVGSPLDVAIVPPPVGVPFLAFSAKLAIQFGSIPTKDAFGFASNFILSSTAPAINPVTEPVTLQVGTFTTTIPPGSFKKQKDGSFTFEGAIHGVGLGALIKRTGTLRYLFEAKGLGANLTGTVNTVYVTLAIGGGSYSNSNSGATSVTAEISH